MLLSTQSPAGEPERTCRPTRHHGGFSHQITRYLDIFGPEQTLIIIFEDFASNTRQEYLKTLHFLDLADDGKLDFPVVNSGDRRLRYASLSEFIRYPPPAARKLARLLIPGRKLRITAGGKVARRVLDMNMVAAKRPPMDLELRARLQAEFADEQAKLEHLLARELPWGSKAQHPKLVGGSDTPLGMDT